MDSIKKEDMGLYLSQIRTNVSFSAFMTAVVIFFAGVLITKFKEYDISVKIPICFLIIGTFGFLYASLIYTNACEEVLQKKIKRFKRNMLLGDVLSEYLGVYLLVLSIPLAINIITTDLFLQIIPIIASLGGLALYQFSHFSISERHFPKKYKFLSIIIIAFGAILFLTQLYKFYFEYFSAVFIFFIILTAFLATRQR